MDLFRSSARRGRAVAAWIFGAASLGLSASSATAEIGVTLDYASIVGGYGSLSPGDSWMVGWGFTANTDLLVTHLGVYDHGDDGLVDAQDVGLYDSSGNLLASASVDAGAGPLAMNSFRFHALGDGVILSAGQNYFIGTYSVGDANGFYSAEGSSGLSFNSAITELGGTFHEYPASGLVFPTMFIPDLHYFGANLLFTTVVPAPGVLALIGCAILAGRGRRRR